MLAQQHCFRQSLESGRPANDQVIVEALVPSALRPAHACPTALFSAGAAAKLSIITETETT